MDISVIIVSWRVKDRLKANLESLFISLKGVEAEVFVVDNNSQDGTLEMLATDFPEVKVIANSDNLGFAKANNQAIRKAQGDFILLLNPDMLLRPDTLSKMLSWAKFKPQAVVSGCRLEDEKGNVLPQIRNFPKLADQLAIVLKLPHFFPSTISSYLAKDFDYSKEAMADSIRGAFFLINRSAWKTIFNQDLPLLDERYFIWFEEVDFCKQVYQKGGQVWYYPGASCQDFVGQSFAKVGFAKKQRYFKDSMLAYFRKWQPAYQSYILACAWKLVNLFSFWKK